MIRKVSLTIALLCASAAANAEDIAYIGLGVGSVDYDADAISSFNDPTGFEFILGKEINRNLSFEISYIDFGEADDGATPLRRLEGDAFTVGALLGGTVGKTTAVFVKLGMLSWDREATQDGTGVIARDDGTDIFYGFGVKVKATESLGIGARYNVYDFDGDDVSMLSINAELGF